jgi:hypothetical protein
MIHKLTKEQKDWLIKLHKYTEDNDNSNAISNIRMFTGNILFQDYYKESDKEFLNIHVHNYYERITT